MHTVIDSLVLVLASVAGQGISVTSVLITVVHVILQDVQDVIPATTEKLASLLAVKIVRMDAVNPMANVLAVKITDMERGATTFALLFVPCVSKMLPVLCVMPDDGVICAL